ncbi:MAG: Stk1 family PASTA domain-containing Ser/Thr kinase [Clostridia bacterium]|nr:Stk1 family PASTA domain-containing Ser/Thr kinase [Clostridia bacterium]
MMDNYLNQVIGERYEIQEIIGIGGMSVVYKAYDRLDARTVAIKILKDEFLANEEFRLRFKNESKAIAMLSHPNIVKVYDVSFGEKLQYIVMEYVEGITLKEYIERQKILDWKEALHFVVQILRALQHAHDKGIVHRDIKPQNIMLLPNATIKVADFGIARFSRAETRNLNESSAIGSVHYISPEQARGENTDGRADIYSVGVVLYEMITGKLPFDSESDIYVAIMQMQDQAIKPSAINPAVPEGMEQIILRAMQKNPADRYQSAAEFLFDLDEFKRNPQIKFDYSYFIDQTPTKYLDTSSVAGAASGGLLQKNETASSADGQNDAADEGNEDEEEENTPKNVTLPVLIGIAAALVVVVGIILGVAFSGQMKKNGGDSQNASFFEKIDVFGWFSGNKVEVPNFINMDFEAVLEKYPDLAIENPPQYVYNTTYEAGKVCDQTPAAGKKITKDTVIKLTVATNSEMVLIKDVTGMNYLEAETLLRAAGFVVELIPKTDADTAGDLVINTEPSVNTYAEYQSKVYVYYSATEEGSELIRVPNVVGDELEVAKKKINAAGLNIGSVVYDSSSVALEGYVIGQTPTADVIASGEDYVNLIVGNGVLATETATLSIFLPNGRSGEKGDLKTYLNNNVNDIIPAVSLDGSAYTVSFTGSGKNNSFKIYIDSTLIYSGKIDFTSDPPSITDISTFTYATKETIPDVVGKTADDAQAALKSAGFANIRIVKQESDTVAKDLVIAQSPVYSNITQYQTTTVITLTVSSGSAQTTAPPQQEETTIPPVSQETTSAEETSTNAENED